MKRPFNIFPSIGYRNSQFQIVSSVDALKIDIYNGNRLIKSVDVNSNYPTVLTSIESTGKLCAICTLNNEEFKQEIEVKDALRLGSSEFKKAFVFDDTNFSFFLMKDRLLLYDEKKQILLTENHYSPTEIQKIGDSDFLFITKVGSSDNGIVNLGIYNTDNFSIVGELLNDYQEIKILNESNKAWLLNIKTNIIHCFQLVHGTSNYFAELKTYVGFDDFFIDDALENLFLIYSDKIIIADLFNLHKVTEIAKEENNAIDKFGNIFSVNANKLNWKNAFANFSRMFSLTFEIRLQSIDFLHLGDLLNSNDLPIDFKEKVNEMKDDMFLSLPLNISSHFYPLPEEEKVMDSNVTHKIFPTSDGLLITEQRVIRKFRGISFVKKNSNWTATPYVNEKIENSITNFESNLINFLLIDKSPTLLIKDYHSSMLLVTSENTKKMFFGGTEFNFTKDSEIQLFSIDEVSYFLVKKEELFSLYTPSDQAGPLLENIKILNYNFFKEHKIIWYSGSERINSQTNHLNAFDLLKCSRIAINQHSLEANSFNYLNSCKFEKGYALTHDNLVFNPKTLEIKSAVIGKIESQSTKLNKILSRRENILMLSIFNVESRIYDVVEINIEETIFKETYLSPDGQFLVFKDDTNEYYYYDIEKQKKIHFISGSFIGFNKDGSLITSNSDAKEPKRTARIIDPKTFQDITPPNYRYYRFLSPDGKLYSETSTETRLINLFDNSIVSAHTFAKMCKELKEPSVFNPIKDWEKSLEIVRKNRELYFENNKMQLEKLGITSIDQIASNKIIKKERFVKIGIVGTDISAEVTILDDIQFFNYAAFSHDNKFFAYVGKPVENANYRGFIHIREINFDKQNSTLECSRKSYLTKYPPYATWVCGFSKKGYFATYDSTPVTYCLKVDEEILDYQITDIELSQNSLLYNHWVFKPNEIIAEIKGKNFLCFSPSGKYLALSEQGYDPLTIGGYGHQESNVVHIANPETGEILNSFTGHGGVLKETRSSNVAFVAFSEDEKRLMTLSKDGVIFIRDISLENKIKL